MSRLQIAVVVAALTGSTGSLTGCPAADDPYGSGSGTPHKGTTTGPKSSGQASSGTGGSTGSTGGSGTTGGTTGTTYGNVVLDDAGCPAPGTTLPLSDCDGGLELIANLVDYCTGNAIPGSSALDITVLTGTQASVTADACGYFHVCVPPDEPFSFRVHDPNYYDTLTQTFTLTQSEQVPNIPGLYVFCDALTQELSSIGADPNQALLGFALDEIVDYNSPTCYGDGGFAGWSFTLTTTAGDPVDASLLYISGTTLAPGTVTTSQGTGLFYNIDPSLQEVVLTGNKAAFDLPDGGSICPFVGNQYPFQFSTQLVVQSAAITNVLYVIP